MTSLTFLQDTPWARDGKLAHREIFILLFGSCLSFRVRRTEEHGEFVVWMIGHDLDERGGEGGELSIRYGHGSCRQQASAPAPAFASLRWKVPRQMPSSLPTSPRWTTGGNIWYPGNATKVEWASLNSHTPLNESPEGDLMLSPAQLSVLNDKRKARHIGIQKKRDKRYAKENSMGIRNPMVEAADYKAKSAVFFEELKQFEGSTAEFKTHKPHVRKRRSVRDRENVKQLSPSRTHTRGRALRVVHNQVRPVSMVPSSSAIGYPFPWCTTTGSSHSRRKNEVASLWELPAVFPVDEYHSITATFLTPEWLDAVKQLPSLPDVVRNDLIVHLAGSTAAHL